MSDAAATPSPIVRARKLIKYYEGGRVHAVDQLDVDVTAGEFVAICGPSGCGKSTLLNLLAGIDRPDRGELEVCGRNVPALDDAALNVFRATAIGLVFQMHNLLPNLTANENVQVSMLAAGVSGAQRVSRAAELLERVGLADKQMSRPPTLSGGERQRVAIARALANNPPLLLADEPTGALDSRTGEKLFELLESLRRESGMTLLVVTHDEHIAERADRTVHMLDGRFVNGQ